MHTLSHTFFIEILKRFLPEEIVLRWEFVEPSRRSGSLLKPEMLGMHDDLVGELVGEREEYGSSSSASSHSYEDFVNFDGVPEHVSDFE